LRLLRSIKYGVRGTSMTPWGDYTSALQRMQLVMFIRKLVGNQIEIQELSELLYDTFDTNIQRVNEAREGEFAALGEKNARYKSVQLALLKAAEISPEEAGKLFQESLVLEKELKEAEEKDERYKELIGQIKEQRDLLESLGVQMLSKDFSDEVAMDYFALVKLLASGAEILNEPFYAKIISAFDEKISSFKMAPLKLTELPDRDMKELLEEQRSYVNLKSKFVATIARVKELIWKK